MDMLTALALSIGVLIALWVKVGTMTSLLVPAGIIAWACFFAAGGKTQGLQKTIAATLSGLVWVWLPIALISATHLGSWGRGIFGVGALTLGLPSRVAAPAFIPGAVSRA